MDRQDHNTCKGDFKGVTHHSRENDQSKRKEQRKVNTITSVLGFSNEIGYGLLKGGGKGR